MITLPGNYLCRPLDDWLYENTIVYIGMSYVLIVFSREPLQYTVLRLSLTGAFVDLHGYINDYSANAEIIGSMLHAAGLWPDDEYLAFKKQQQDEFAMISNNSVLDAAIRVLERQGYKVEKKN